MNGNQWRLVFLFDEVPRFARNDKSKGGGTVARLDGNSQQPRSSHAAPDCYH